MNSTKEDVYNIYSSEGDMTFIMKDTYDEDGELLSTECIGWYYGEPTAEDNITFAGKLKAEYTMGRKEFEA